MNYVGNEPAPGGLVLVGDTNPVGSIVWGHKVPDGSYLALTGQIVSKVTFADLWTYAQGFLTADQVLNPGLYKSIDANTFALPKLDGLFIRSTGQVDASHVAAALGVKQADDNLAHTHAPVGGAQFIVNQPTSLAGLLGGAQLHTVNLANSGGTEARPVNVALVPSVKALKSILLPSSVLPTIPPLDFVLLDTKDFVGGQPNIDFTNFITSAFQQYLFVLLNLVPTTNDSAFTMRLSTDGGATFPSGGSDYFQAINVVGAATNTPTTNTAAQFQISGAASNPVADGGVSGEVRLFNPAQATQRKLVTYLTTNIRNGSSHVAFHGGGWYGASLNAVNAVRFFSLAGGNFLAGRIKMYGLR